VVIPFCKKTEIFYSYLLKCDFQNVPEESPHICHECGETMGFRSIYSKEHWEDQMYCTACGLKINVNKLQGTS